MTNKGASRPAKGAQNVRRLALLVVVAIVYTEGCGNSRSPACEAPTSPGLIVTVIDGKTRAAICDAQVVMTNEASGQVAILPVASPSDCRYFGNGVPGTFDLRVGRAGFTSQLVPGLQVAPGPCNTVLPHPVTIALDPVP